MKKIYFAQVNNVIADAIFLPLSVAYIWEYCKTIPEICNNYQLGKIIFERDSIENYMNEIVDPDVFAFSTYVWNWNITQKLAIEIKKKYPNCLIIFGGPQVPYKKEWLMENRHMCDYIVTYAGEKPFAEILLGNINYPGVISENGYAPPKPDKDINYIPSPYLSGLMNSLIIPGKNYSAIIETNRGCPYACAFCDQEALYYNKIQLFNYDRVIKEIDWIIDNKIDFLYFADSNVGIFDRDIDIIKYIAKKRNETGYPRHIDYSTAKQQPSRIVELGKVLNQEAKIKRGVTIALQSMNSQTLDAIKRINVANEKLSQIVKSYNDAGIDNYCELIIGLPLESFESWVTGIGKILELGSDHALTTHPLSVVPNTPFMDPKYIEKYGLKYTATPAPAGGNTYPDDSKGEIDYICYSSNTMTADEWINSYFFAKGIVIPHHYHGVSQVIATYLQREYGIDFIEFYKLLYNYSLNSNGLLNREYKEHTSSVKRSLFEMETWGRPIPGGDNFHFQDNGATAAILYMNIDEVHKEIIELTQKTYNINVNEVAKFNKHILDTYNKNETSLIFNYNWNDWFFEGKKLTKKPTEVIIEKKSYISISDHAKHIFWFGRKSKRCFLPIVKKELFYDKSK